MREMTEEEIAKFEDEAERLLKPFGSMMPVSRTRILNDRICEILLENCRKHESVIYESKDRAYSVSFRFVEAKIDGKLAVYTELPEDVNASNAITASFMVDGFHRKERTEVQLSKGEMLLNIDRDQRILVDFQRAVLRKGIVD